VTPTDMAGGSTRALFIDRDGVINIDHGYVHRIDQFEFIPGIFELARFVTGELGWPIIVATNQAGIGRGYFDEAAFETLTQWMCERFRQEGAPLARVYHCPYHAQHGVGAYKIDHPWRKPRPGMFLQAATDFGINLAGSALIGDQMTDIEAAAAAGIGFRILLRSREPAAVKEKPSHTVAADLHAALTLLRDLANDRGHSA
jgi:D-glycero-D-manno-heptose 1,7-bisphosphate phosphatase